MSKFEMDYAYGAGSSLRDQLASCDDRMFVLGGFRTNSSFERETLLNGLFGRKWSFFK